MIVIDTIARGRFAMLVATVCVASGSAMAQAGPPLYWPGDNYGYGNVIYDDDIQPRRRVVRLPRMPKEEAAKAEQLAKNAGKPTGPLVIAISLEQQSMKVYDSNGLFAESPISSGIKGHTTPMGVFSVIQKNKWHRSNLYSDAPMPFMQRLTWSGIALHAGVVPGYPASHGCVRMPMTFAVRMWSWARMGARVVITPGDISPVSVSHPLLTSMQMPVAAMAQAPAARLVKSSDPAPVANNTRTADASNAVPAVTMLDAVPAPSVPAVVDTTPKRSGPIAIFVSRKDTKLYVRQNFLPLFDVPVTISGDQPLGTHVFTAYADKNTDKPMRWTALSLPATGRMADEPVSSRRRETVAAVVVSVPLVTQDSATEALNRLQLPDDVMARLGAQLVAGSSLVISDQSITASGETGKGTDFIVRLR